MCISCVYITSMYRPHCAYMHVDVFTQLVSSFACVVALLSNCVCAASMVRTNDGERDKLGLEVPKNSVDVEVL